MQKLVFCVAFVLFLTTFLVGNCSADRKDFYEGLDCSVDGDCFETGVDNKLTCVTKKCKCPAPSKFYYGSTWECRIPAGAVCPATPPADPTPHADPCTTGAPVTCSSGFKPDGDECVSQTGTCVSRDDECNESKFQVCNLQLPGASSRMCGCAPNSLLGNDGKCQLKPTQTCTINKPHYQQDCSELSECTATKDDGTIGGTLSCACKLGLSPDLTNTYCRIPHDQDCSRTDAVCDTSRFQTCLQIGSGPEKKCQCEGEGVTTWYNGQTCELLIGADCSKPVRQKCVDEAENWSSCVLDSGVSKCACDKDLTPSMDGKHCYNGHHAICKLPGMNAAICNQDKHLECLLADDKIDRCSCSTNPDEWYDPERDECSKRPGTACTLEENEKPCSSHAQCNATSPTAGRGICECEDRFSPNKNWECRLNFGEACDADHPETGKCDEISFQKCNATTGLSRCTCTDPDNMIFEDGVCKTKAEKTCSAGVSCVEHASCDGTLCKCGGGKTPNARGQCVGKLNVPCIKQSDCDAEAFLECASDLKCACANAANAEYNVKDEKCYLKLNSPCEEGVGAQCSTDTLECLEGKCGCSNTKELILDTTDPNLHTCARPFNRTCGIAPDMFPCSASAHLICSSTYTCACMDGYKQDGNATHPRCGADRLKPCAANEDCRRGTDLQCTTSKVCECPPTDPWDVLLDKCGAAQFSLHLGVALIALLTYLSKYV